MVLQCCMPDQSHIQYTNYCFLITMYGNIYIYTIAIMYQKVPSHSTFLWNFF